MHQISDEATLDEYNARLASYTRKAESGQQFVLVDSLQDWLRSPVEGGGTHADRLLHGVAYKHRREPGLPIASENLKAGDDCCLLVFCILQVLGRGDLIHAFSRKEKVDRSLPLSLDDLRDIFKTEEVHDQALAHRFSELQHRFRPARFELHGGKVWDENMVVPIYRKSEIRSGGTASLWQIDVPEEFIGEKLRDKASGSRLNANTDEQPDWQYRFALKTFPENHVALYQNEVKAFQGLKEHDGMVRWLADYEKLDMTTPGLTHSDTEDSSTIPSKTYNILLEYGLMDLDDYFNEKLPPVLSWEIEAFWKSLFAVAFATKGIHDLKVDNGWETKEYFGWHADIKPDNILLLEDRLKADGSKTQRNKKLDDNEITFKLADPGFAKFVSKHQENPTAIPKEYILGGTTSYGAPEYPGRNPHPVSQAIDIWSLACVFSLAATWIVCDYTGLALFQKVRQRAIRKHRLARSDQRTPDQDQTEVSESDQFHDGNKALEAVTEWHKYLRTVMRRTDTVTSQVLDVVDYNMLLAAPEDRITASDLCTKLDMILKSCPCRNESQLPQMITTLLGEVDEEESCNAAKTRISHPNVKKSSSSGKTITSNGLNVPRAERPLVTTHRQSIWPNQSLRLQDGKYPENQSLTLATIPEAAAAASDTSQLPQTPRPHIKGSSVSSTSRPSAKTRRSGPTKRHPSQNYFQACEAIERHGLSKYWPRDNNPDGLLTSYFRGTRDIIFLVDNASSMNEHWYEATKLLELLVKKAKGVDDNGMDLRFTTGSATLRNEESASKFVGKMEKARPKTASRERAHTDLRSSLGHILHEYSSRVKNNGGNSKDAVVIILTDGVWAGMEEKLSVAEQIKTFSDKLRTQQLFTKHRPFSIQFIQFGNDQDATDRLRYLDDYLQECDMIDTEHSTGDVNKMLLGSFVEAYDRDEGDEITLGNPPESLQQIGERTMSPESDEGVFDSNPPAQNIQRLANYPLRQRAYSTPKR